MSTYQSGWVSAYARAWGLSGEDMSKDPQFAIAFEILEGPDTGKTITWYGGFGSDAAFEYTMKAIRRCGWTGSDINNVELAETPVSILIEEEEYNGKVRTKVKAIGNGGGGGIKSMDPNAAKSFAAKMAGRIKAFDLKNGGPPKAAARPSNGRSAPSRQPGEDDDFPG